MRMHVNSVNHKMYCILHTRSLLSQLVGLLFEDILTHDIKTSKVFNLTLLQHIFCLCLPQKSAVHKQLSAGQPFTLCLSSTKTINISVWCQVWPF